MAACLSKARSAAYPEPILQGIHEPATFFGNASGPSDLYSENRAGGADMPISRISLLVIPWVLGVACNDADERDDIDDTDTTKAPDTFEAQAALGAKVYAEYCAECHGASGEGTDKAPRLVGLDEGALPLDPPASRKVRKEQFVTVADVANFAVMNMPANKPGSLSTKNYLAVLAFDLKANGITLKQPLDLDLAETLTIPR